MTYTDNFHRLTFRKAVFAFCGTEQPRRAQLKELGRLAAERVKRECAWGGAHLYVLIHFERYPKYGIHPDLYHAVLDLARGAQTFTDVDHVLVYATHVRAGSVVLARSRRCARARCKTFFVPLTPQQKFYSNECAQRVATARRRAKQKTMRATAKRKR